MEKFKVRKLNSDEISQVNLVRKFDDFRLVSVHIYSDIDVILSFNAKGYDFTICFYPISPYVVSWIKYKWVPEIAYTSRKLIVFDYRC